MKRINLFFLFFLCAFSALSQSAEKGKFYTDLNGGMGVYNGFSNMNAPGQGINAAAFIFDLRLNYLLKERFSGGLQFQRLVYPSTLEDSTRVIASAGSTSIRIVTDHHWINKQHFQAFVGAGLGIQGFRYDRYERDTLGRLENELGQIRAGGASININTGLRWLFSKHVGLHFRVGYSVYPMQVREYRFRGEIQEMLDYRKSTEVILNFRGVESQLGLSVCF